MVKSPKRLCTICARGGSKGVPGKNLRLLYGKPLVQLAVEQALRSGLFDAVAVSSDSAAIREAGSLADSVVLVERPSDLASDVAGKVAAIRHALLEAEAATRTTFDVVVDLDVTAPLRSDEDVADSVALLESGDAGTVLTASESWRSPWFNMIEIDALGRPGLIRSEARRFVRRQDAPRAYDLGGGIVVWRREVLLTTDELMRPDTRVHVIPRARAIDIDDEVDFAIVEVLMAHQLANGERGNG